MSGSTQLDELIHEMRNALTIAKANLEAFIDGKLPATPQRLGGVLQALTQVESMLDDLRVLGPTVNSPSQLRPINVCQLLEREYNAIVASANAKEIAVNITRCAIPVEECQHFVGDPVRIGLIIKNVLLNAVRYTPPRGVIAIDCSRRADQVQIQISDTGPGIQATELKRIFEPGFRGSAASAQPGSGYGLALVKRFVEEQGGQVSVATDSGQGARFTVRLPGSLELAAGARCAACGAHAHNADESLRPR